MNFLGIGGFELVIIAALAFFLLGPKKMIETSRSAGKLLRELKNERDKFTKMVMSEFDDDDEKPAAAVNDPPSGAVSRPRGRMSAQDVPSVSGDSADSGKSDDDQAESAGDSEDPVPPAGGAA